MESNSPDAAPELTREDQRLLLRVARESIAATLHGEIYAPPLDLPSRLLRTARAFVTLHLDGDLRGCIGTLRAAEPLPQVVANCARSAAIEDPRFPPLAADELKRVDIEISLLGDSRPLRRGEMPRPGLDGVIVSQRGRQGLLLPQVASEHGWDGTRLLEETCRKAGLPRDAWAHGARTMIFQAQVFSEAGLS